MKSVVAAFRPKTLTAAVVPCFAATALAYSKTNFVRWDLLLFALFSAVFIQIGTNLVNDAFDFKKGADTKERIGPQRLTQAGILSAKQVMALASLFFSLAVLLGIPLVIHGGWVLVLIGILSVMMGYAYTAGPYPLAYLGLGDLFVVLFFGLIAVGGMYFLQTLSWSPEALILGLQIGFHATVLIAINNMRDMDGDRKVGKRTMAVRFGLQFSRREIFVLIFFPFVLSFYWMYAGHWVAGLFPWFVWPIALSLFKKIRNTPPGPEYNQFLAQGAALHLLFGLSLAAGFLW